ncbi:tRNA (uracil(54)-C(5))-methyltransferase homolog isoform X1 [Haliotis rufescens]|uniref:tRNA (uracil(54)-C(5))-methyltransferase homolog isoform X1 n=2 Tax=Haliotis rufescens TaxID=6454 RepID=UPI00201FA90B|nr:tRNA (uracil(54)-C(5))-methyltransferase homolog isoform X1 [Haliotis rufescens]
MNVRNKQLLTWCVLTRIRHTHRFRHGYSNRKALVNTTTEENQYERLAYCVTPYYRKPYDTQLKIKESNLKKSLQKVINIVRHTRKGQYSPAVKKMDEENDGQMCALVGVKPAPEIYGYRNKDEMSIGPDVTGDRRVVGLYVGKGSSGKVVCVSPQHLVIMKKTHVNIINAYQDFLDQSAYVKYGRSGMIGYWDSVVIRSSQQQDTMVTVMFRARQKSADEYQEARDELRHFFQQGQGRQLGVTSLFFRPSFHSYWSYSTAHHVMGSPHIFEEVLSHKFRISPDSFFQTNTPAAVVLYSTVRDYVKQSGAATVIDVCCGTGTIGILMADLVQDIVGVEMVKQAIEDAVFNAENNGVMNAEFVCGKAHRFLRDELPQRKMSGSAVAVVNPGRNGINKKVVNAIRQCKEIRHLIYVSCKPSGNVLVNFADLIVPRSDKLEGEPFVPVEAVGVDMFPHTTHCELVVMFSR